MMRLQTEDTYNDSMKLGLEFWAYSILFATFMFVRNVAQISMPNSAIVLITCAISFLAFSRLSGGREIAFYAFVLPFQSGLSMPAVGLMFNLVMAYKQINRRGGKIEGTILPLMLIAMLECLNVTLGSADYVEYACFLTFLLFMYQAYIELSDMEWNNNLICKILCSFVGGLIIASLIVLILNAKSVSWQVLISGSYRVGKTGDYTELVDYIVSFHVNVLADFCLMGITSLILLIHCNLVKKLPALLCVLYLLFVGFLTQARTFLLVIGFVLILVFIVFNKKWWRFVIPFIALVFVGYYIYLMDTIPAFTSAINRFFDSDMSTMSGRTIITKKFNELLFSNPIRLFIGYGVNDYHSYSTAGSSHNGTQELFLTVGIIGAVALIMWCANFLRTANFYSENRGKKKLFSFIPLIALLLYLQANQFLSMYYHMPFLIFGMMCAALKINREPENL